MANVFDVYSNGVDYWRELADDLDGILSSIAYGEAAYDLRSIRTAKKKLIEKYGWLIDTVEDVENRPTNRSPMGRAINHIIDAWCIFLDIDNTDCIRGPESRIEEAEEVLNQHLIFQDNLIMVYDEYGYVDLKEPDNN